jgi:hypothetical protein
MRDKLEAMTPERELRERVTALRTQLYRMCVARGDAANGSLTWAEIRTAFGELGAWWKDDDTAAPAPTPAPPPTERKHTYNAGTTCWCGEENTGPIREHKRPAEPAVPDDKPMLLERNGYDGGVPKAQFEALKLDASAVPEREPQNVWAEKMLAWQHTCNLRAGNYAVAAERDDKPITCHRCIAERALAAAPRAAGAERDVPVDAILALARRWDDDADEAAAQGYDSQRIAMARNCSLELRALAAAEPQVEAENSTVCNYRVERWINGVSHSWNCKRVFGHSGQHYSSPRQEDFGAAPPPASLRAEDK